MTQKHLTAEMGERLFTLVSALSYDEPWRPIYEWICEQRRNAYRREHEEAEARCAAGSYKDSDLVYAAYARCDCGAGLAYPPGIGVHGFWDCSDILTGRAAPKGRPGSKQHSDRVPFAFYEIKSEKQPSVSGATTRANYPGGPLVIAPTEERKE